MALAHHTITPLVSQTVASRPSRTKSELCANHNCHAVQQLLVQIIILSRVADAIAAHTHLPRYAHKNIVLRALRTRRTAMYVCAPSTQIQKKNTQHAYKHSQIRHKKMQIRRRRRRRRSFVKDLGGEATTASSRARNTNRNW